jgi:D-sedoheptulose 7-phosphate isomerase
MDNQDILLFTDTVIQRIQQSIQVKNLLLQNAALVETISTVARVWIAAFKGGSKVWFCGNGGSAADAQHLASELSGRYYFDRPPLPSEALHVNTSYLTAVANDYGYQEVFARYVDGFGKKGDVLVGLSTSGNSKNVVRAFEVAKKKEITTIAFTGMNGGELLPKSDYIIAIPSTDTPKIQESHIMIGHILCEIVEKTLFQK